MAELNDMIPFDELSKIESRFKSNIKTKLLLLILLLYIYLLFKT